MLIYIHGMDSGPFGQRASRLKTLFPTIKIPQLTNNIDRRIKALAHMIREPSILIGSSLGGLTTLVFARDYPHLVSGMILIAPAVGLYDPDYDTPEIDQQLAEIVIPDGIPVEVLAGKHDEVVRLSAIRDLIRRSPNLNVGFHVFDDDHLLLSNPAWLCQCNAIRDFLNASSANKTYRTTPC